jgi:glycerol-3-phosphate dehydrogenase subunit B
MTYDVVVIGLGLAGLTAALRLAEQGQRVLLVAKGVGGTHLAPATIDVLGYVDGPVESPARSLPELVAREPGHPYARLSSEVLRSSLAWFGERVAELGYRGGLEENFLLPTAVGVAKPTALLPQTMAAGDLRAGGRFVFVGLRGLKDFYPGYLAANLARARLPGSPTVSARAVELAPPLGEEEGDVSGVGFARRFERPEFRETVLRELKPHLAPGEIVGFPAVLGLRRAPEVWQELEAGLRRRVFEVPTLPPSVGGIRVYESLTTALRQEGARIVVGCTVSGAETDGRRLDGVVAQTANARHTYRAGSFVLASGGFASGGLQMDSYGRVRETVLDLSLVGVPPRGEPRFEPGYFDEHPIARAGLAVDDKLRPLTAEGGPAFENLHAAGATIAGAAPWREASGNGLSLATGYAAASAILESTS